MVKMTHQYRFDETDINLMVTRFLRDLYAVPPEVKFKITIENVPCYTDEGASAGSRQEIVATQVDGRR
jgi:hypothetical protein